MTAGLNLQCSVVRITDVADDVIGGAQPSGTVVYRGVPSRISARRPTQVILEQGIEVKEIFTAVLTPGTLVVKNNDQIQVTYPVTSPYYGLNFRVLGVQHSSMTDSRGFLILNLRRIEQAMSNGIV